MLASLRRNCAFLADRAYDTNALRAKVAEQGLLANIRPLSHRRHQPDLSPAAYRLRNAVERFSSKLKQFPPSRRASIAMMQTS